ncbi:MAG: radical SAM protein [Candidatus Abyssobacteria bacterium SURF_17]|jgi:radical SAM protein with 4Fe4S-binding SPASM domain|uniref:Radical SAM protein n=1 Tax=Candidatus Abyssobacteria bacterium SURF_17 TaxID=2093361 RepID=A0A419EW40_9BACT|nr:MAG: radical SAM protein [Candidatus Abyssubacteria bacterium SURF_17]
MWYGMKIFRFGDIVPQLPNIIFRRRFKFSFELLPYEVKGLRWKRIANFFVAGLNQFFTPSKPFGYPVIAQVEPTNFCNLSCPLCFTTSVTPSRTRSVLPFDTFKKLIDEVGDYLLLIILWNWGEPFLNPDIFKMISYAKSRNIVVHSSTNGNVRFDEAKAEQLVDSGLDSLVFGVDGATRETYSVYRKGGDLDQVIASIKAIVSAKKRKGAMTPRLNFRFVVMKHNEHEIPMARRLAEELGVDFFTLKTVDMPPAIGNNLDGQFAPDEERYRRYAYEGQTFKRKQVPFTCMRPWKRITVDALGEVISCEYEYKDLHSFGNLSADGSPMLIWKGERARAFRRKFNLGDNRFYLCRDCTYKNRVVDDCTVEKVTLKSNSRGH